MTEPKTNDFDEEDTDVCLQCNNRREKESQAFRSAMRKVALLTAICSVLCVLTITACCCSLYLYTRFQGFRQELVTLVRTDPEGAESLLDDHFAMDQKSMPMYGDPTDVNEKYEEFVEKVSQEENNLGSDNLTSALMIHVEVLSLLISISSPTCFAQQVEALD